MTKAIVDQEAREKIMDELTTNFLIEAGAGSGKTTSLVERMVNLIYKDVCPINKIVAITFTKKAADELKLRFQSELEKKWKVEIDTEKKEQLNHAIQNMEQCFIGTVHAFCAKLLRERPIEAKLDINFHELEQDEDNEILEEAWHIYLYHLKENNDSRLKVVNDLGINEDNLFGPLKEMKEYPDIEWVTNLMEKPDVHAVYQSFSNLIKEASRLLPEQEPENKYDNLQKALIGALKTMRHLDMGEDKNIIAIFQLFNKNVKPTFNRWDPEYKEDVRYYAGKIMDEFQKSVKPLLQAWWEYSHSNVVNFLYGALETYEQLKQERSLLNFQDLLLKTNALLKHNAEVRKYFQQKYQCLLVDEFQDTDPIQAEIMFFLTSKNPDEKVWTNCRPKAGSLFVVGDPKQAIYRFRRADMDTYNRVKQLIEEYGGEVLQLTMNFRTIDTVTERLNDMFEKLLPEKETTYQAAYRPLHAFHEDDKTFLSGIKQITVSADYTKKDDVVVKDAENIARYIWERINEGYQAKDFMVLNRYNEGVATYAQMIEDFGIPVSVSGNIVIGELVEFRDMLTLLKTFIDPTDSVAFVATLRSTFFGISDEDLYKWKRAGALFTIYSPIPKNLDERTKQKFELALTKLSTYQKWIRSLSPTIAIEKIMEDVGFYALLVHHQLGKRAHKSLLQILERLKQDEVGGNTTFRSVYQSFAGMIMEETEVANLEQEADAVRIMNVHKAKGLEAPIVFLAHPIKQVDLAQNLNKHIKREDHDSKGYFSFSLNRKPIALPLEWDALKEEELRYLTEEEIRIMYVAATRAEKALIISSSAKSNRRNPWKELLTMEGIEEVEVDDEISPESESLIIRRKDYERETLNRLDWLEKSKEATYELWSPTDDKGVLAMEREAGGGKEWGTVIHDVLEKVVKGEDITQFISNILARHGLPIEREAEVKEYIRAFKNSDVWKALESAEEVLTEVPFNLKVTSDQHLYSYIPIDEEQQEVYVSGVIDLIYKYDGEWFIVDYKTDRVKKEEDLSRLRDYYKDQVQFYKRAWEYMTEETVKDVTLFFFSEALVTAFK